MSDPLARLDAAARTNLDARGQGAYARYKAQLLAEGTPADEMEEVLTGFIWDESETRAGQEQDDSEP